MNTAMPGWEPRTAPRRQTLMRLPGRSLLVIILSSATFVACGSTIETVGNPTDSYPVDPTAGSTPTETETSTTTSLPPLDPSTTFSTVPLESTTTLWGPVTTLPEGWPTSTTVAPVPMGQPVVTLEPSWDQNLPALPIHVRVGDTIAFVAPAYSVPVYHEDGSVYDPLPPEVRDPALLRAAVYTDTCQVHTTCAAWIASAPGTTTVAESGPSGLVCDLVAGSTELSCAGVAAAWWSQDIVVDAS